MHQLLFPLSAAGMCFAYYMLWPLNVVDIDAQRIVLLSLVPISLSALILKRYRSGAWVVLCVFVLGLLGTSLLGYNAYLKQLSYVFLMALLLCVYVQLVVPYLTVFWVFWALSIGAFFLVVMCGVAFNAMEISFLWKECFVFSGHPRFWNHVQVATVPVLAACAIRARLGYSLLVFLGLSLTFYVALVSQGRGVWLAILLALGMFLLLFGRESRRPMFVLISGLLTASFLYGLDVFGGESTVLDRGFSSSGRIGIWSFSLERILERPWFGWGAYAFADSAVVPTRFPAHPHQIVLQLAFEYGVPLALFVVSAVVFLFHRVYLLMRRTKDYEGRVYLCALFGLAVNAQYSGVLTMPLGQFVVVVLAGLLLGRVSELDPAVASWCSKVKGLVRRPIMTVVLMLFIAIATGVWLVVVTDYLVQGENGVWNMPRHLRSVAPRTWHDAS